MIPIHRSSSGIHLPVVASRPLLVQQLLDPAQRAA